MQQQMWFGGDYNPEQWPEATWDEDVTLMSDAGVNLATINVFSWARIQPQRGRFDFDWLDAVMEKLHAAGVAVDLATATASPPPWLSREHPEMLPVTEDGIRLAVGSRQAYCPSSPVYREAAAALVTEIATRYGHHPALRMWHVNNEFGCHVSRCYCETSARAFRKWLRGKYTSVEVLNDAWGTSFWSQRYSSFDEIGVPSVAPYLRNPTQLLDFDRFSSHELLECYRREVAILRQASASIPITTNFMGFFKPVDYWGWASEVDVVSDDSYPDPADPEAAHRAAMSRDLMRSLAGGAPWILMEQAVSAVNWRPNNARKSDGQMSALSLQAVARGANAILFFQWRQSLVGAEKFHSGMLPHSGTDTRAWRSVVELGSQLRELARRPGFLDSRVGALVAIVLDWDSWWAIEQPGLPASLAYLDEVFDWHRQFTMRGLVVDFVRATDDLATYSVVITPTLFTASDEELASLAAFADAGGSLVVTYQTGVTDDNLRVRAGGYLGSLRATLGIWVEEFAPLDEEALAGGTRIHGAAVGGESTVQRWAEVVRVSDAHVEAYFTGGGDLDGSPAITRRTARGEAWYVATGLGHDALSCLVTAVLDRSALPPGAVRTPHPTMEVVRRGDVSFFIDHARHSVSLHGAGEPGATDGGE